MIATLYKDFSDSSSIVEIAAGVPIYQSLANINFEDKRIIVNGQEKTPDCIPVVGDVIIIRTVPGAAIAITIFVAVVIASAITAGIAAYNVFKMRKQIDDLEDSLKTVNESVVNLPYLKGASNAIATNKTQPYIIGEHLFTPYFLSTPYYDIGGTDGVDQYYIAVLEAGFAKQVIREIKCEEVTIKTFSPSETVPQEGTFTFDASSPFYDASSLIEIAQDGNAFATESFNKVVASEQPGVELKKLDDTAYEDLIFTLDRYAKNVSICVMINGLRAYNDDGDHISRTVAMSFQYSLDSGESWNTMISTQTITRDTLNQLRFKYSKDFTYAEVDDIESPVLIKIVSNTSKSSRTSYDQVYIEWVQSDIYDPDASAVVSSFVDAKVLDDVEADLSTMIGIKIKATASNQDALRKVNIITAGVARTWTGSAWGSTKVPTRNLAAWILESLTSPTHKASQLDDSEIDMESIGDFYTYCATNNITADLVLSDGDEKRNLLATLCDIGNCVLYKNIYDEMSIAVDAVKENAIAVLNTQNLLSFEVEKTFGRQTDGIRVSYVSRDRGYDNDSYLVMRDGVTRGADSLIRDLPAPGRTDHDAIVKYARLLMAIETLRPRTIKARTGKEGIYYTPLAKVLVQHPALSNGLGSAEIKSAIIEGGYITGVELYEPVQYDSTDPNGFGVVIMAVAADYCTQIAKAYTADTDGLVYTIDFVVPILASEEIKPHPGDNLSYGYLNDGEFDTITSPMLIAESVPDDTGWLLTLVDYNEAIYDAGTIPDYTPNITIRRTPLSVPSAPSSALDDANANTHLIYELFQKNTSTTTPPTFTADADDPGELWTTAMPSISAGEYIWKLRSGWLGGIRQGLWEVARLTGEKGEQGETVRSNLLRGTIDGAGWSGLTSASGSEFVMSNPYSSEMLASSTILRLDPGQLLTISGESRGSSNLSSAEVYLLSTTYPTPSELFQKDLYNGDWWQPFTMSFNVPMSWLYQDIIVRIDNNGSTDSNPATLYLRNLKLEVGGVSTAYIPNALDLVGTPGDPGLNGTRTASIELYKWASSAPSGDWPVGYSTYTWSTGDFTEPETLNGWSKAIPSPEPGKTLYQVRAGYSDSLTTATSYIMWPSSHTPRPISLAGVNGINGTRIAVLEMYKWATSAPSTYPQGTSVLTWASGIFTEPETPNGWGINPGPSSPGQKLYATRVVYADNDTSATDNVTWPSYGQTTYETGYAGTNGTDGSSVNSNLLRGTIDGTGWSGLTSASGSEFSKSNPYSYEQLAYGPILRLDPGQLLTISGESRGSSNLSSAEVYLLSTTYPTPSELFQKDLYNGDWWQPFTMSFNVPMSWLYQDIIVRIDNNGSTDSNPATLYLRNLKLEVGGVSTAYIPNYLDLKGENGESSLGLGIKPGYSSFSAKNDGECYIHGFTTAGVAQDADGYIYFDDAKKTVTKGAISPNFGMDGHILIPVAGGSPFAAYFKISNQTWYSVISGTEAALTEANYLAIGEFVNTAAEVTESASLYPRAKRLTEIRNAISGACLGIAASVTTGSGAVSIHQVTSGPYAFTASGVTRRARPGDCVFVRGGTATTGIGDTVKALRVFDGYNWEAPRSEDYETIRGKASQSIFSAQRVYQLNGVIASSDFDAVFDAIFANQVLAARVDALTAFIEAVFATNITATGTISGGSLVGATIKSSDGTIKISSNVAGTYDGVLASEGDVDSPVNGDAAIGLLPSSYPELAFMQRVSGAWVKKHRIILGQFPFGDSLLFLDGTGGTALQIEDDGKLNALKGFHSTNGISPKWINITAPITQDEMFGYLEASGIFTSASVFSSRAALVASSIDGELKSGSVRKVSSSIYVIQRGDDALTVLDGSSDSLQYYVAIL